MDCLKITSPCGAITRVKSAILFQWTISDFTTICDKVKPLKFIRSPIFPTNIASEHKCYMKLFPNGDTKENEAYLSIYAQYVSTDGIAATARFNLLSAKGEIYTFSNTHKDKNIRKVAFMGVGRLVDQNTVLNKSNGILRDGSITITCEITEETNSNYESLYKDMEKQIRLKEFDDFEKLFENGEHSDLVIIVEDKKLLAHKCILSTKSSVFAAMFQLNMIEKTEKIVEINDIRFEVMRELLRFFYIGKVGDIKNLALDLYKAADKYNLDGLKDICEDNMCQNLSITNVFDYLHFTYYYKANKLKTSAIDFIALHSEELKPIQI